MALTLKADPAHSDRWLISESENTEPKLGAQLTDKPDSKLTVYWSGHPGRADLLHIIDQFSQVLTVNRASVEAKLIAYGQDMRAEFKLHEHIFSPLPKSSFIKEKGRLPLDTFDACRAEFTAHDGTVVVWANVTGLVRGGLDKGGENIGVTLSPNLFYDPARQIIERAIEMTSELRPDTISKLLDRFSESLLHRQRPAAG